MDLQPLWIAVALIVIGFVLSVIGEKLKPAPPGLDEPPTWDQILRAAAAALLAAVMQIIQGPSLGHRIQGLGSALAIIGVIVAIGWLILVALAGTQTSTTKPTVSPSPS